MYAGVKKKLQALKHFAFLLLDIGHAGRGGDVDAEVRRQLPAPLAQEARRRPRAGIAQADAILR